MSTATHVPEMNHLEASDATTVVRQAGPGDLLSESFLRFRHADGFSFARSLAFQLVLTLIPATIFVVAVAARLGEGRFQSLIRTMIESLAPGPAGDVFLQAFRQGATGGSAPVIAGALAMLIAAVTAMAQLQRGASRIYGVDVDRPTVQRYALATGLTLTVGMLLSLAFVAIALGQSVTGYFRDDLSMAWRLVRLPAGLVVLAVGLAILYRIAPNRHQPRWTWLATGGAIAVTAWFAVSAGLAWYLNASSSFGDTYGPLAGIIGFMLWAQLSAIAILFGLAVAAQMEARWAGVEEPVTEPNHDRREEVS